MICDTQDLPVGCPITYPPQTCLERCHSRLLVDFQTNQGAKSTATLTVSSKALVGKASDLGFTL